MNRGNVPQGRGIQTLPPVITVAGGDARALAVARRLAETVCAVRTYALGEEGGEGRHALPVTACPSFWEAWAGSTVLVLPLPATRDGETVFCPLAPAAAVGLAELARAVSNTAQRNGKAPLIFGGCLPGAWREALEKAGGRVVDYFDREDVQIRNAQITAEGAVMTAMELLDVTLMGASVTVVGYGRIGQLLSRLLRAMGAEVTVVARRAESRAWAVSDGCRAVDVTELGEACRPSVVVFNTAPTPLLDGTVLDLPKSCVAVIDLASLPGGVSATVEKAVSQRGWPRVVRALSIPGRYAPVTAGQVIADAIMDAWGKGGEV